MIKDVFAALRQRAPGFGLDFMRCVPGMQLALLHKRMKFDLVNHRRYAGFIHQPLEMIDLKVAHADALNQTFFLQVDHVFPRFNVVVDRRNRPVHQV